VLVASSWSRKLWTPPNGIVFELGEVRHLDGDAHVIRAGMVSDGRGMAGAEEVLAEGRRLPGASVPGATSSMPSPATNRPPIVWASEPVVSDQEIFVAA